MTAASETSKIILRGVEKRFRNPRDEETLALAVEPSVLFMDEPFAAIDAFTRLRLQDELLRLWQEKRPTVVFVTRDLDEAVYLGGKVVLMAPNPGRVQKVVAIDLPRPCDRTGEAFGAYRHELFHAFQRVHKAAQDYVI